MPTVDIYWSGRSSHVRMHLDPRCSGLERAIVHPREARTVRHVTVPSLAALAKAGTDAHSPTREKLLVRVGRDAELLPCRACALEPVLDAVMNPSPSKGVFMAFSALPSHAADPHRYATTDITQSAVGRLERIAGRAGLQITQSRVGPVAFGRVRPTAAPVIAANLRSLPSSVKEYSSKAVSIVWSLLDDSAVQGGLPKGDFDPWEVAERI